MARLILVRCGYVRIGTVDDIWLGIVRTECPGREKRSPGARITLTSVRQPACREARFTGVGRFRS